MIFAHFREIAELSITELSLKTGVHECQLVQMENNDFPVPLSVLKFYADFFDVDRSIFEKLLTQEFDSTVHEKTALFFQKIIFSYLKFSKWLESFDEKN